MTRKDFEIIALILRLFDNITEEQKDTINALLTATNANFNAAKFWSKVKEG